MRKVVLFFSMVAMVIGAAPVARADVTDVTNAVTELPAALTSNGLLQAQSVIDYGLYLSTVPGYACSPPEGHQQDTKTALGVIGYPVSVLDVYEAATMTATCTTIYPDSFPMTTRVSFEYLDKYGNWNGSGTQVVALGCDVPVAHREGQTTETEVCANLARTPWGAASLNHWHHAVYEITAPVPLKTYSDIYFVADGGTANI